MTRQPASGSDVEYSVGELKDYGACSFCDYDYTPCHLHEPVARSLMDAGLRPTDVPGHVLAFGPEGVQAWLRTRPR